MRGVARCKGTFSSVGDKDRRTLTEYDARHGSLLKRLNLKQNQTFFYL